MSSRIDGFDGTPEQYIDFLEKAVICLRQHHHSCGLPALQSSVPSNASATSREPFNQADARSHAASVPGTLQSSQAFGDCQLEVIQWDPQSQGRQKSESPQWKKTARLLVQMTPKAEDWGKVIRELGLHQTMCNGDAAVYLLDGNSQAPTCLSVTTPSSEHLAGQESVLLRRIKAYAQVAMRREVTASLTIMLANFQKFLVLSSCAVLYATGVAKSSVLEIAKICTGDVSDEYCWRILRTAIFLNQLIDVLNTNGWEYASELVLIWNRSPSFYFALACSPHESLEYLRKELSDPNFTSNTELGSSWTPLFVPSLVHQILQKTVHVARISHVLGYKHAHVLGDTGATSRVNPWQFFNHRMAIT